MKIQQIDIYTLDIPLIVPVKIALGRVTAVHNIALKITADNGQYGWGEASPFAPITGDSQASNYQTAQQLAPLLIGKNPLAIQARLADINRFTIGEPSIRCAFDIALHDLAAKIAGLPLYAFLGGEQSADGAGRELRTDLTIGLQDSVEQTVAKAEEILAAGFNAIKLKTGRSHLEDVAHVAAVRERVGPDISIKIDSNQGWSYQEAIANLQAMAPLKLEYSEQPIAAWDHENLRRLRHKVALPICADESVFDHRDAFKLTSLGAVDYLNIKLGKSGGIDKALKINAIAEAAGCLCMIGCFAETRLALSAAAHLALARPNIYFLDLDSAYKHKEDPVVGGMTYDNQVGGRLNLPETPGHGAAFDEEQLDQKSHVII